jgi:hypothetical protein
MTPAKLKKTAASILEGCRHRLPKLSHRGPPSSKPVLGRGEESVGFDEMRKLPVDDPL